MIAKITRGNRVGDIAAYLHGPGHANEHHYTKDGQRHSGGMVIASTIGAEGATDPAEWAADIRHTQKTRPDITKSIWQTSLRTAPGDRTMSDREWADAASRFMDEMEVGNRPWVAVRHGDDHIHIVLSRVDDFGEVWHGRNDRRAAQRACAVLEEVHGLAEAPRRKEQPKRTVAAQREAWREAGKTSPRQRLLRRKARQLTQPQWDALDTELQEVIRLTSPERVPGAHVPESDSTKDPSRMRLGTSGESRSTQRAQNAERRSGERGYER